MHFTLEKFLTSVPVCGLFDNQIYGVMPYPVSGLIPDIKKGWITVIRLPDIRCFPKYI